MMSYIASILRAMFFGLDSIIFGLIDDMYDLLMQIARTTIFDQDALHSFSRRIYAMLGLFMLFKVMISIINYVLNPDELVDKEKGFSSIIKRVIISLVLVVIVPFVFTEAYELQRIVLEENTLMTVIFGSPGESYRRQTGNTSANSTYYNTAGKKMQFTLLYAFTQPNYDEFSGGSSKDLVSCRETYEIDGETGNFKFRKRANSSLDSRYIYVLNEQCFGTYNADKDVYESSSGNGQLLQLFKDINDDDNQASDFYQNYAQGVAQQSFELFFVKGAILAKDKNDKYFINYRYGISTAIGVATLYLLLIFCIDIAGRSIKLGFLQLISPIPIISYCDPKSGKDGMFKKWYTMCFKAYAELFVKLAALYFGIYIISLIGTFKDVYDQKPVDNWIVNIFMIIGVLIFVKKLPEILKDALGIDLGGGKFELNPLKKLENDMLGGKLVNKTVSGVGKKATGLAGGLAAGSLSNVAGLVTGQGMHRKNFLSALASGWKGDKFGKMFASSYGAGRARHKQLQEMDAEGVDRGDEFRAHMRNAFGVESPYTKIKRASDRYKAIQDTYKSFEATAAGVDAVAKDIQHRLEAAKAAGDHGKIEQYSKLFDARIKEIAQNKGKVVGSMKDTVDTANLTVDQTTGLIDWGTGDGFDSIAETDASGNLKVSDNAALANYAQTMDNLAASLNKSAVGSIDGATTITADTAHDIKSVKNQAQGNQQSIDSNSNNMHQKDVDSVFGSKK